MSNRELKSLISDQQNLPAVRTRLRSGKVAAMSDDDTSGEETASQILELQQKLSMAHEELEKTKTEADKQIQEARETVEKATQEAIEAKQAAGEWQTRVADLERELERADKFVTDSTKERKQWELEAELERLRQLEDLRQRFDKERERHREERERDAATVERLKKELESEKNKPVVVATAALESGSTSGADATATTAMPKESSESVSEHDSTSTGGGDGDRPGGKKVTFGATVVVGSSCSGASGSVQGSVDSGENKSGGGQSVQISGTAGGASMRSPDSGEAGGEKGDSSGENHSLVQSLAQLVKTQNQMVEAHTRAMLSKVYPL